MRDIEGTGNEFVGDFCNGYIDSGWDEFDEEKKLFKRGVELINGRASEAVASMYCAICSIMYLVSLCGVCAGVLVSGDR